MTSMVALWRQLLAKETRSSVATACLENLADQEIPKSLRDLLKQVSEGGKAFVGNTEGA